MNILNKIKNQFIPHKGNNHHPHFLRDRSIFFFLSLVIIIELGFLVQVFVVFDKTNFLASVLPAVLTNLTNEDRALNNASHLIPNDLLQKAAQLKANDMATRGYFSHNTPDGLTPWYWLDKVGYKYKYAGENLAVNFFESRDVAQAWMNSPTHRANIVKKEYTEIGIAVADGVYEGQNTVFVVQFFGTPKTTISNVLKTEAPVPVSKTALVANTKSVTKKATTTKENTKVLSEETNEITLESVSKQESVQVIPVAKNSAINDLFNKILTSPRTSVAYSYRVIVLLFVVAMFVFLIKKERKHPLIIAKGSAMVAFIVILMILNINITAKSILIPNESTEASVIAS